MMINGLAEEADSLI